MASTKEFYSFADGKRIPDHVITGWLESIQSELLNGVTAYDCSSGDVSCYGIVYPSLINICVATADGYCAIRFASLDELRDWKPRFCRNEVFPKVAKSQPIGPRLVR